MTDVLSTEVPRKHVQDLDARLRDVYDALPHEFKVEVVDGELHFTSPSGERLGTPAVFRRGGLADAEPAVPGWRFAVDEIFD